MTVPRRARAATIAFAFALACFVDAGQAADAELPRHPEEIRALVAPEDVLAKLPAKIAAAQARGDVREVAMLRLAEANACRVVARRACQTEAARAARESAHAAGEPHLEVRGLLLEASSATAAQDYVSAERVLAVAERVLEEAPSPLLSANVLLTYSSIADSVGDHAGARDSAQRGLDVLGTVPSPVLRVRLLRNRARAEARLGQTGAAVASFDAALAALRRGDDPRLDAELHLEVARLGQSRGDVDAVRRNAAVVLAVAGELDNAQLRGSALELLGQAARDAGDRDGAVAQLRSALDEFRAADARRDERRTLRELVELQIAGGAAADVDDVRRLLQLEAAVDAEDQAHVAESFDARLQYERERHDVDLLRQSIAAAAQRQRYFVGFLALAGLLLATLVGAFVLQRRNAARLAEALQRAQRNEARFSALADNLPASIAQLDAGERFVQVNAHLARTVGRAPEQILGSDVQNVGGQEMYAQWKPHLDAALAGDVVRFASAGVVDGQSVHLSSVLVPDRAPDGQVIGLYALTFDVTELTLAKQALERLARIDSLTGIANRRHFEERLDSTLAHARRHERSLAVLAIDLDRFKQINDAHGHAVGDAVLKIFVARVLAVVRRDDFFARVGGDEFMLLVEEPPAVAGEIIAGKLLRAMQPPITVDELELAVTISIGVAFGDGRSSADALLAEADEALYEAKRAGRGTFRVRPARAA